MANGRDCDSDSYCPVPEIKKLDNSLPKDVDDAERRLKNALTAYSLAEDAALELAPWAPQSVKDRAVNRLNSAYRLIRES